MSPAIEKKDQHVKVHGPSRSRRPHFTALSFSFSFSFTQLSNRIATLKPWSRSKGNDSAPPSQRKDKVSRDQ